MKLVFLTHYFFPESNAPASRTFDHCVRWAKEGVDVTVITCAPNVPSGVVYDGYKNRIWPQREMIEGVNVIRVWSFIAPNAGTSRRILNYVTYLLSATFAFLFFCKRPQLLIATSPQFFCGWAGTICSYLKWCPFLLEVRDIWPESIVAVGAMRRGWMVSVLETMEKWMYLSANHIVAVGNGYKLAILKRAPTADSISVITNGVDPEIFKPQPKCQQFNDRWNLNDKFVCSYIGTLGMAHGLEVVLDAAELLKAEGITNIKFCLIGDGAHRDWLESKTENRELGEWITFTGRLPKEQIPMAIASSDAILVHLKKCDLFTTVIPSKIFETMAMEKPIVMGVDGEAREIVRRSQSGVDIDPGDAANLKKCICQMATSPELLKQLSCAGRDFVMQFYSRDVLAMQFLQIISAIVDKQSIPDFSTTISNHNP